MPEEIIFAIGLTGMTKPGIKGSSAIVFMIPCNRMISHLGTSLIAILIHCQKNVHLIVQIPIAVPFVRSLLPFGQKFCCGMVGISHDNHSLLTIGMRIVHSRMIQKVCANHSSVSS